VPRPPVEVAMLIAPMSRWLVPQQPRTPTRSERGDAAGSRRRPPLPGRRELCRRGGGPRRRRPRRPRRPTGRWRDVRDAATPDLVARTRRHHRLHRAQRHARPTTRGDTRKTASPPSSGASGAGSATPICRVSRGARPRRLARERDIGLRFPAVLPPIWATSAPASHVRPGQDRAGPPRGPPTRACRVRGPG
jgi:hypothetical protein